MPSPFPGMDPYLEHPARWESVHHWLIPALGELLGEAVPEHYRVAIERRVYLLDPDDLVLVGRPGSSVVGPARPTLGDGAIATLSPSVEVALPIPDDIRQGYLEVREVQSGEVVTVVEILSPTNKEPGAHRREYLGKRERVRSTETDLIEVDLLPSGPRMPMFHPPERYDYGVLVARSTDRSRGTLFPFSVRDPLPRIPLPLRPGEPEPEIPLQRMLDQAYDRGHFERWIDYDHEPVPPLPPDDAAWAAALLRAARLP